MRLERWSTIEAGSSEKVWARVGGDAEGIGLKGGNMAEGESWAASPTSPEKLGLAKLEMDGEGYSELEFGLI
jgi:hypothetical protein